jgi:hypothetical protein
MASASSVTISTIGVVEEFEFGASTSDEEFSLKAESGVVPT